MDLGSVHLPSVSAVIPAYNEAANLPQTIRDLSAALASRCTEIELIVVNDGSTDDTAAVTRAVAASVPHITLLSHSRNRGYGAALRTGFAAARYPWTLLLDADGQFDPREVGRFLAVLPGPDLVIGYRERRADPLHRRLYAACWGHLMHVLVGVRVRDLNCGFKLMRTGLVQSVGLISEGAFISTELLAKVHRLGAGIVEVPVTHRPRVYGRQTGGDVRVLLRAFYELARLWWTLRRSGVAGES